MGTTLDAIQAGNVRLQTTAVIEGLPYVLTDGDPTAGRGAYVGSGTAAYNDYDDALGGLTVYWDGSQRVSPWKPFTQPALVKFTVVPASRDESGSVSGPTDILGETVFKRVPATYSGLAAAVDANDLTVTVQRADDFFGGGGALYIGPETMSYSSRDTATDMFTIGQRGLYPALLTDTGDRFARSHKPLTASEVDIGIPPVVTSTPTVWVGRYVSIWLHRNVEGVLDVVEPDGSAAFLAFAGTIVSVSDVDGATVFEAQDVRDRIYSTRLNRDPFKARVAEGVNMFTGQTFSIYTSRQVSGAATTVGNGNSLSVVASGAVGTNQINAGLYTAAELGAKIDAWLQAERSASRILFNVSYSALAEDGGVTHGRLRMSDPTTTSGLARITRLTCSWVWTMKFLGWDEEQIEMTPSTATWTRLSPNVPRRYQMSGPFSTLQTLTLTEPRGTWVSQTTLLPVALRDPNNTIDGVLKIGDLGYVRARRISDTSFQITEVGMGAFFPGQLDNAFDSISLSVDEDVSLDVSQVLLIEAPFKTVLLKVILSTGTSGFNSATYDTLSDQLACAIPYSALGDDFVDDVNNLSCADLSLTALIDGPVSFMDLFQADFVLRRAFFVWGGGRLRLGTWATPSSAYASYSLTEASKAAPSGTTDTNRSAVTEQSDYYNIVTLRFNIDATGEYRDTLILRDAASIRAHGERAFEIKARNTFRQGGGIGAPIDELVSLFSGFFGYTSRPWQIIRRSIDHNAAEQVLPGTVLSITDKYVRDPATGLRYSNLTSTGGISGYPGLVVGHTWDWGGAESGRDGRAPSVRPPGGEVDVMISPQRTLPGYVPCAEVDETAATAGYVSATKTLTCKAHAHSDSTAVADATRFVAGDKVLVIEIDPSVPGSAQSWSDTVASQTGNTIVLTTGLAGYVTTGATLYRVIYDAYATVTSTQKAKAYQADDADGMIVDTVQAYGFGFFGSTQIHNQTASATTDAPSRYATNAYGDGKALDTGYERDAVRLANNGINYKTAPQCPSQYTEVRNFTGAGTWQLVECFPIFLGMGGLTAGRTRLLSIAPRIRSTTGATASCRVTLGRRRPTGTTRNDVTRVEPYVSATFTSASTTYAIPTASTLDIAHCKLTDALLGGVAWIYVEIATVTEVTGLSRQKLGALA